MGLEEKGYCEITCQVLLVREKAIYIDDGVNKVWIPRSQIEAPDPEELEEGASTELLIPEWLAIEKGLT